MVWGQSFSLTGPLSESENKRKGSPEARFQPLRKKWKPIVEEKEWDALPSLSKKGKVVQNGFPSLTKINRNPGVTRFLSLRKRKGKPPESRFPSMNEKKR